MRKLSWQVIQQDGIVLLDYFGDYKLRTDLRTCKVHLFRHRKEVDVVQAPNMTSAIATHNVNLGKLKEIAMITGK